MNTEYEYYTVNNYDFVKIDGNLYLIDTGAPSMLSHAIVINGKKFNSQNFSWLNKLKEMIGFNVELIGKDILDVFGIIEVNKINHTVIFGKTSINPSNHIKISHNLMLSVEFNGYNVIAYLDTGAPICCADSKLLKEAKLIGPCNEPSFNGTIHSKKYISNIVIGNFQKEIEVFERVDGVNGNGIDLIFSISPVSNKYYVIDLINGQLYFE